MPTWAPIIERAVKTSFGRSRQGADVNGLMIHHQANGAGPDAIAYMANPNSRDSHPTYATDKAGRVVGIVHPSESPSSTGYAIDSGAVTIEVANIDGAPEWDVPDEVLDVLAHLIVHHAGESPRAAHPVEVNDPGRTQAGFWVGWHSQYGTTACPGPDLLGLIPAIVARANERRGELATAPRPQPRPEPSGASAPTFPLPSSWYFGPAAGPVQSVSGHHGNAHGSAHEHQKNIARFQRRMIERGWLFPAHGADGLYGAETRENTLAFQREKSLAVDGLIGPATWRAAWSEPVT